MKLAMAVGDRNHYRIDGILGRHFLQTADRAGLPKRIAQAAIEEVAGAAEQALAQVEQELPPRFPAFIHTSVSKALIGRIGALSSAVPRPLAVSGLLRSSAMEAPNSMSPEGVSDSGED
jgi:serine/threonine-protein kinase HipA